jgi:hypothetical protein
MNFVYPEELVLSGILLYKFEILDPSMIMTKSTMEKLTKNSFKGDTTTFIGSVPAQVNNIEEAESFKSTLKTAVLSLKIFSSGSFLVLNAK